MIGKNNVFNIRYVKANNWKGQIGHTRGFCDFDSVDSCIRAAAILIFRSYYRKNIRTYAEIINRYAPASENMTDLYIKYVCGEKHFPFDVPETVLDRAFLLSDMAFMETNTEISEFRIIDILKANKLTL